MPWYEPEDGGRGRIPGNWDLSDRDPLGDLVASRFHDDQGDGLELVDLRTGAVARRLPEDVWAVYGHRSDTDPTLAALLDALREVRW